ncbi:hypothetical protein ACL9RL_14350 [Plantibacter sp. Mn2098]|uniref:hypothetical protein n=1 Tax=Plantibacter sp. Mn2098 TaxID=3395266 RepID=UPI003BCB4844
MKLHDVYSDALNQATTLAATDDQSEHRPLLLVGFLLITVVIGAVAYLWIRRKR